MSSFRPRRAASRPKKSSIQELSAEELYQINRAIKASLAHQNKRDSPKSRSKSVLKSVVSVASSKPSRSRTSSTSSTPQKPKGTRAFTPLPDLTTSSPLSTSKTASSSSTKTASASATRTTSSASTKTASSSSTRTTPSASIKTTPSATPKTAPSATRNPPKIEGNRESRVFAQHIGTTATPIVQPVLSSPHNLVSFITNSAVNLEVYTQMDHTLGLKEAVLDKTRMEESRKPKRKSTSSSQVAGQKPKRPSASSLLSNEDEDSKRFRTNSSSTSTAKTASNSSSSNNNNYNSSSSSNNNNNNSENTLFDNGQTNGTTNTNTNKPTNTNTNTNTNTSTGSSFPPSSSSSQSGTSDKASHPSIFGCPECPVYRPTVLEFSEPLEYIASIRGEAQKYGLCRIIPPPQWKPKWDLAKKPDFVFSTRLQVINKLYTRYGPNCHFLMCLREHLHSEGITLDALPKIGNFDVDLFSLSKLIASHGGLQNVINKKKWSNVADALKFPKIHNRENKLQGFYYKYLLSYDMMGANEKAAIERVVFENRAQQPDDAEEAFGFEYGDQYTLEAFEKMANDFREGWFKDKTSKTTAKQIEAEYWKILEDAERHVSVSYGSDIDTTKHGSGFSTDLRDPYSKFGWNLNVLPGLEGSILKHVSGISGISMPWMYIGMLFSSFCWHNEDNYLYSINYHHHGAPKQWYGVPGRHAPQVEASFRRQMPDEFKKRPLLMHDLVTMVSPAKLMEDGVPVCSTLQHAGHFVVTFPRAYHGGFSLGFNCGEAVNFGAADWIPFGLQAIDDYSNQRRPVSLNQEQLILNTAKHETNKNTLRYTMPEMLEARQRESSGRMWLVKQGIRQTTFDQFTGGLSRDLGNIFQPRSASKMPGTVTNGAFGGGGVRHDLINNNNNNNNPPPVNASVTNPKSGGGSDVPSVCDVCYRVCHLSMVVSTSSSSSSSSSSTTTTTTSSSSSTSSSSATAFGAPATSSPSKQRKPINVVRCLMCMKNDASLGVEHTLNWQADSTQRSRLVLVCRYSLDELDDLITKVKTQLQAPT